MAELDLQSYVDIASGAISGPGVGGKDWGLGFDAQLTLLIPLTILNFAGQTRPMGVNRKQGPKSPGCPLWRCYLELLRVTTPMR